MQRVFAILFNRTRFRVFTYICPLLLRGVRVLANRRFSQGLFSVGSPDDYEALGNNSAEMTW